MIKKVKYKKFNIVLLLLILVIAVVVVLLWATGTSQKEISSNGTFEDQYVKFNYPTSLVAVQYTFENYTIVDFYNSNQTSTSNYVGNIRFSTGNLTNLKKVYPDGSSGQYNGYRTWQGENNNGPYIYILLSSTDAPVKILQMDFKSEYKSAYKEILNTLKIKKIPA
ncbi:LRR adjacent [Methanobacterium formicicum]|uniref:LRR adjacent n=1 Tax=Methanobacterium formicicum TaxID=2162 RepID=UPI000B0D2161|nr:LRR adjacent [Methanobacterium formicicum]